ncbi:MAG: hypothetical protein M3384_17215 [Acidobacteriota bacterium]|nr:hypothetical protein [Acidobacteriota bacterium]
MKKNHTLRRFLIGTLELCLLIIFLTGLTASGAFISAGAENENGLATESQPAQNGLTGQWTAEFKPEKSDELHIMLQRRSKQTGFSNFGVKYSLGELPDLKRADILPAAKTNVNFRIQREAGTIGFEGYFREGEGAGFWKLTPNQSFVSAMRSRGYADLTEEDLFVAVIGNVTVKFYEDLKSIGYDRIEFHDLFRAAAHDVTPEFIAGWRAAGFKNLPFDELIELGTFNVTPEFFSEIKAEGFPQITPEDAVQLKVHEIDRNFIRRVRAKGFPDITLQQLIKIRNHDIIK